MVPFQLGYSWLESVVLTKDGIYYIRDVDEVSLLEQCKMPLFLSFSYNQRIVCRAGCAAWFLLLADPFQFVTVQLSLNQYSPVSKSVK
jgi:hypothetical protein